MRLTNQESAEMPSAELSATDVQARILILLRKEGPLVDALLLHKEMNTQQLAIATGYHRNTVPQYVSALHQAGLINKRDGKFSLKEL